MLSKTSWNTAQVREVTEARDVKLDDDIMEIASHAPYKKDIQLAQDFASKIREIAERLNAQVELNENLTVLLDCSCVFRYDSLRLIHPLCRLSALEETRPP